MRTICQKLIDKVKKGYSFKIDFINESIKVGNKYLVKDGKYKGDYGLTQENVLKQIEMLYHTYKYSTPSIQGTHRKAYFKCLDADELTDEELCVGENREVARAMLESFILGLRLSNFDWNLQAELVGKWFWQGKDKDLVIYKDWF